MAILIGEHGTNVRSRVVEDPVQEADHALIPLHSTVEQTACPWDQVRKLGLAMKVLAQVNLFENKYIEKGGSWVPDKAGLAKSYPEEKYYYSCCLLAVRRLVSDEFEQIS